MLSQEKLKEHLKYDSTTGLFFRRITISRRVHVGDIAGSIDKRTGYNRILVCGKRYQAHRLVWLYVYGEMPKKQIDHINHSRSDNRLDNLRLVSNQENAKNKELCGRNKSGVVGVHWYKNYNKWCASIRADGKDKKLGYFQEKADAIQVRKLAEVKYGYHENHGIFQRGI